MDSTGQESDGGQVSRRGFLRATGGAAAAAALAGCTGEGGSEETDTESGTEVATETAGQEGSAGQVLRLVNDTMTSLDPVEAEDTASGAVTEQLFDGLVGWPNGGIPIEAVLAEEYETDDEFTTYTFSVTEGASFHNGVEVTAADVVYSYERLAASENSLMADDILTALGVVHETDAEGRYVPGSMAVEAVDEYTVELTLREPFHSALQVLANNQFAVIPEGIVGDVDGYEGEYTQDEFSTTNPVGAGPFAFESWESGTSAAVSAFDDYHGSGPEIDGVAWQVIEDDNAVYNYAMNRNADAFVMPTAQFDPEKVTVEGTDDEGREFGTYGPVRNGETMNYLRVVTQNVYYVGFNMQRVEKPVRQAFAYALDQHTVAEQVFKGRGIPAYHYTVPTIYPGGGEAYDEHAESAYPYGYAQSDLEGARAVMEEAGYGENDRAQVTFTIYESNTWDQIGQLLRDQLASAYVDVEIEQAPFSTLLSRVREGNIEAFSLGWNVPWAAPDAFTKHINPATSDPTEPEVEAYNFWPEDTPAARRAIEAWETIQNNREPTDEAERVRNEAYVTMEESNWEDVANLPVYHLTEDRMWYDDVDIPRFGTGGAYRQKFNEVTIERSE